jgi:hypothetical protein
VSQAANVRRTDLDTIAIVPCGNACCGQQSGRLSKTSQVFRKCTNDTGDTSCSSSLKHCQCCFVTLLPFVMCFKAYPYRSYSNRSHCFNDAFKIDLDHARVVSMSLPSKQEFVQRHLAEVLKSDRTLCEPVNHVFHRQCLIEWFDSPHGSPNCPACRTQLFHIDNARLSASCYFEPDHIYRPPTTHSAGGYCEDYSGRDHHRRDPLGPQLTTRMTPHTRLAQLRQEYFEDLKVLQIQQMTLSPQANIQTPVNRDPGSLMAEERSSAKAGRIGYSSRRSSACPFCE